MELLFNVANIVEIIENKKSGGEESGKSGEKKHSLLRKIRRISCL